MLGQNADARHVSLVLLALLAVLYTLHLAPAFLLPIVLAILLNLLLSPLVRLLRNRLRIPEPLGAGIVIVVLLGVLGFGTYRLTPAATAWVARAPESMATIQRRIQPLRQPVEKVTKAAEQVEQATDLDKKTPEVEIKGPSLTQQLFGGTTAASEYGPGRHLPDLLPAGLRRPLSAQAGGGASPAEGQKNRGAHRARDPGAGLDLSRVTTMINTGVGIATGVALALVGMPNPVLWGVVAGVLNFVPVYRAAWSTP